MDVAETCTRRLYVGMEGIEILAKRPMLEQEMSSVFRRYFDAQHKVKFGEQNGARVRDRTRAAVTYL